MDAELAVGDTVQWEQRKIDRKGSMGWRKCRGQVLGISFNGKGTIVTIDQRGGQPHIEEMKYLWKVLPDGQLVACTHNGRIW